MPVNSTHLDYDANIVAWQRARDVFAGEDAVKVAAEKYLPRLDCQDDKEYLASFFNASARTADGFVGLIFRRDPTFKLPNVGTGGGDALAEFVEDADMLGTSQTSFSKKLVTEIIGVGRAGTLVDWNEEAEQRAYAVAYAAEDIINWHTGAEGGVAVLEINPREPQIHGGLFASLVERAGEPFGLLPVLGLEALEFAGGGVEGVINALAAEEQAITCFHVCVIEPTRGVVPTVRLLWTHRPTFWVIMTQAPKLLAKSLTIEPAEVPNLCRRSGKEWSQWPGLNWRPTVYETVALPLSYIGLTSLFSSAYAIIFILCMTFA